MLTLYLLLLINSIRPPDIYQNAMYIVYLQVWVLQEQLLTSHLAAIPPLPTVPCLAQVAKPGFEMRDGARGKQPLQVSGFAEEQI